MRLIAVLAAAFCLSSAAQAATYSYASSTISGYGLNGHFDILLNLECVAPCTPGIYSMPNGTLSFEMTMMLHGIPPLIYPMTMKGDFNYVRVGENGNFDA